MSELNHYLIDIKNDPCNHDLEHNYEEDEEPIRAEGFFIIAKTDRGEFTSVHNLSISDLAELINSMRGSSHAWVVLKSAMILADARAEVAKLYKKRELNDILRSLFKED